MMGSRKELVSTIEQQQDKLKKYENKLRDVVHAYKGLVKEKEALEASLKALTVPKPIQTAAKTDNSDVNQETQSEKDDQLSQQTSPETADETNDAVSKLHEQISVLTNSLSTLTAEKTRIETSFQADKKRLMQEKDDFENKLQVERNKHKDKFAEVMVELGEVKSRLKVQQQERDQDESNHALMLRELHMLLSSERTAKECLQHKLEDAQNELKKRTKQLNNAEGYENKLHDMSSELKSVRERLQMSEEMANKPSPMLMDLHNQLSEMKARHNIRYEQEKLRANEAERKLMTGSDANENRVAALEAKLSQLSDLIGNYDRLRIKDQLAITKLKDRVSQLDQENTALAKAACKTSSEPKAKSALHGADETQQMTVQELIEQISKLKNQLRIANQKSEIPLDIDDILKVDFGSSIQAEVAQQNHVQCQDEINKIKDEFEKYKARAQSVLKNKNNKDNDTTNELSQLKSRVADMKDEIASLKLELESEENLHKSSVVKLESALNDAKNHHVKKMNAFAEESRMKIMNLEQQMQNQRERTLAVLEEKDEEISSLRSSTGFYLKESRRKINSSSSSDNKFSSFVGENEVENGPGNEVISMLSTSKKKSKSDAQMLHYQQEIARLEVEMKSLRKAKHDLESSLREMQGNCSTKEERYSDEIEELKAKISRLELSGDKVVNLEYLKNVVFNFIKSKDGNGKLHMLNAIATLLHFTPKEFNLAKQHSTFNT